MKIYFLIVALAFYAGFNAQATEGKVKSFETTIGKLSRSYKVYEPADLKKSAAVMLVLHGGTGSADHSIETMNYLPLADKEKFLVVFPNGTGTLFGADRRVWNAGLCCAAAIPVAGSLVVDDCQHGTETALLHIHGIKDKSVPYLGGVGEGFAHVKYRPLQESIDYFAKMKKCSPPTTTKQPNGDEIVDYKCGTNPPVKLMKIKELTHAWPGGSGPRAQAGIELSAPVEAWNFAKQFSLK